MDKTRGILDTSLNAGLFLYRCNNTAVDCLLCEKNKNNQTKKPHTAFFKYITKTALKLLHRPLKRTGLGSLFEIFINVIRIIFIPTSTWFWGVISKNFLEEDKHRLGNKALKYGDKTSDELCRRVGVEKKEDHIFR